MNWKDALILRIGSCVALMLALSLSASNSSASELPIAIVRLEIESDTFKRRFSRKDIGHVQTGIGEEVLVPMLTERFPFIIWSLDDDADALRSRPRFIIRLEEVSSSGPIPDETIRLYRKFEREEVTRIEGADRVAYAPGDSLPDESGVLKRELASRMKAVLSSEVFFLALEEQFVAFVPIAKDLKTDPDIGKFVVPVERSKLRAHNDSRLQAKFRARRRDDLSSAVVPVVISMELLESVDFRLTWCKNVDFEYAEHLSTEPFSDVMDSSIKRKEGEVNVYFTSYIKDLSPVMNEAGLVAKPR